MVRNDMMNYLKEQKSHIQLAQQRQNVTAASRECMQHFDQCSNHRLDPNQSFHASQKNNYYNFNFEALKKLNS